MLPSLLSRQALKPVVTVSIQWMAGTEIWNDSVMRSVDKGDGGILSVWRCTIQLRKTKVQVWKEAEVFLVLIKQQFLLIQKFSWFYPRFAPSAGSWFLLL